MALNTPLSTLRQMLKAELGENPSVGTANDTTYNQLFGNKQQWMAGVYDFPFLHKEWNDVVPPATRYRDFPTSTSDGLDNRQIDFQRPVKAVVLYSNSWEEVDYGIDPEIEYNYLNSENLPGFPTQPQDPIERWRFVSATKYEVWPITVTQQVMKFEGQIVLNRLVADTDTCDLDDMFLVLSVAFDLLTKRKDAKAQALLGEVSTRLASIRANYSVRTQYCTVGGSADRDSGAKWQRNVPIVLTIGNR